jgi:methyltransferase (TIGR00027 family)
MQPGKPSQTAIAAAGYRAMHQLVDDPVVFADPFAVKILMAGREPDMGPIRTHAAASASLRAHIVGRSLLAEETLAKAAGAGVRQYIVLGAGLDTFAMRNPFPDVQVFEIDAASTAQWKQQQMSTAGIAVPPRVIYADIDFEHETLRGGLARAGVDLTKPAVFAWLGVTMYLTRDAIVHTLSAVKALPQGTEIVFDYSVPRDNPLFNEGQERLRAIGEPFISFFTPSEMRELLVGVGFPHIEDVGGLEMNARWFANRSDGLAARPGSHVVRARV